MMATKAASKLRRYGLVPALLLSASGHALAQDAAGSAGEPQANASADAGEIVVTAQRRAERLVDVPISVTALSADMLGKSGVTSSDELAIVTPGLRVDRLGAYVQPTIRGVTTILSGAADGNVATYVDGVYQPTLLAATFQLRDVSSVEVLKGPQGTLFGRNATGGAILIKTLAPDLHQPVGSLSVGYSSFETYDASGFVSVPLVEDRLALSLSAAYQNIADGYLKKSLPLRNTGTLESELVRGKLRFVPWDGADFTLIGLYSHVNDGIIYARTNYFGHNRYGPAAAAADFQIADEPYEYSGDLDTKTATTIASVTLTGDIEAGPGLITTRTSYLTNRNHSIVDGDNTQLSLVRIDNNQKVKNFAQELTYATDQLGRFRMIAGLFFYDKEANALPSMVNDYAIAVWLREHVQAYAAFAELTYDITDRLKLTAGGRYSHERYKSRVLQTTGGIKTEPVLPKFANKAWNSFDPRVSVVYEIRPSLNVYATYSSGFKSGLFNSSSFQTKPINPENIDAYEIGFKGNLGGNLFLTAAAFYYDYDDLQQIATFTVDGLTQNLVLNAATARMKGVEFTGTWQPSRAFSLNFGFQYLDAKYDSFPNASVTTPLTASTIVSQTIDASGNYMIRAPKFSGNFTAQYTLDTSAGAFTAAGTLFATTKVYQDPANRIMDGGHVKLNASLAFEPSGLSGLELRVYGKNLTDSRTISGLNLTTSYDAATYDPPRSFGVELNYRF
jgi:iron complex outermembrane receptor protein